MGYTLGAVIELIHSDCIEAMKGMEPASVDSIVTDPPYGLSFMGKDWDHGVPGVHFWEEALRVAKPGAHLLAFGGTRTFHRLACAIEDAGWEMRDTLMWVYGSGFPKSHDVSKAIDREAGAERQPNGLVDRFHDGANRKTTERTAEGYGFAESGPVNGTAPATEAARQWQGWGTALKPAWEPIIMARKPFKCTVGQNVREHGTGAINVDGCRVPTTDDLNGGGYTTPNSEGWDRPYRHDPARKEELEQKKENKVAHAESLGRWPANVIHDGSDEVVGMFPEQSSPGPYIRASTDQTKSQLPGHVAGEWNMGRGDSGSAARFFYCAKASKADREEGLRGFEAKTISRYSEMGEGKGARKEVPQLNNHPTVKPTDLMRYLCRLVTPPKGTVADLFMGSGSTGKAAVMEGFSFIGMDKEKEYVDIARARIEHAERREIERQGLFAEIAAA